MRRLLLSTIALSLSLAACGGSNQTQTVTLTTLEWVDTTTVADGATTTTPMVQEGDPLEGPAQSVASGTTTTAPLNQQVAMNFAAQIAERLNQKPGPVTKAQIQAAAKTWSTEDHGKITITGWEGVTVANAGNGVVVTVKISGKETTSYVCPGPVAVVGPSACA